MTPTETATTPTSDAGPSAGAPGRSTTWRGLFVPLVTPFDRSGAVALDCVEALAHTALDAGAAGLVALGTTAEPGALSPDERRAVLDVVSGVCLRRSAPLVVGANSAADLAALHRVPAVAAALTLVPPFLRPGEDGVLAYFESLLAASPVPLIVYHVPYRTGQELSATAVRRLAGLPGIVGMKFAPGVLGAEAVTVIADPPPQFAILGGDDVLLSPMLALGAPGAIAAAANVGTAAYAALISAWGAGDVTTGRELGHRLAGLSAALFAEPNPTVIKGVLHAWGQLPTPSVRLPLVPARPTTVETALAVAQVAVPAALPVAARLA
jgi:4-hydroxy-tetrahydrodipicolinate synthase